MNFYYQFVLPILYFVISIYYRNAISFSSREKKGVKLSNTRFLFFRGKICGTADLKWRAEIPIVAMSPLK